MIKNWKSLAGALLVAAALLPGMAHAEKQTLKVGILKIAALTNPWVAQREGIFKNNGLDVELVEFKNGGDAVRAQRSGDVDIILSIPGTAFTAIERGFDLVAIFQNEISKPKPPESNSMQVLVDSPIRTIADLKGKKIAISGLHSQSSVSVEKILQKAGLAKGDYQLVELPATASINALKAKQIDAVSVADPFTTQLLTTGAGRVVAWTAYESIPEQPLGVWFTSRQFSADNPKTIEAFNRSLQQAIDWLKADEPRAKKAIADFTGLDPQLVVDMPMINYSYRVDDAKWQEVVDMMVAAGEMKKPHKASEYYSEQIKQYVVNSQ